MKNLKIAAAVAACLAASSAAFALDTAQTAQIITAPGANDLVLTVAGASAARNSVGLELSPLQADGVTANTNALCQSGTFNVFRTVNGSGGSGPDFRAYSCTLGTVAANTNLSNKNVVVFYRSEGGSAWGPLSLINGQLCSPASTTQCTAGGFSQIKRLSVSLGNCTTTPGNATNIFNSSSSVLTPGVFDCTVGAYDFETDGQGTAGLEEATTELAVSDVEPNMFRFSANYPSSGKFKKLDAGLTAALNTVNTAAQRGFGQVFGIVVNNSVATQNLNTADLAAIFTRNVTSWDFVPNYTATGTATGFNAAGAIKICRREPGSGTQVIAQAQYLGQTCGGSLAFATQAGAPGSVVENTSSSQLNSCVNAAGAIGISVLGSAPPNTHFVSINGVAPARAAAALGTYPFWNELTYTPRSGLGGLQSALATILQNRGRTATTMPNNASTVAIPGVVASNVPDLPLSGTAPVALGAKNKSTCAPLQLTN